MITHTPSKPARDYITQQHVTKAFIACTLLLAIKIDTYREIRCFDSMKLSTKLRVVLLLLLTRVLRIQNKIHVFGKHCSRPLSVAVDVCRLK